MAKKRLFDEDGNEVKGKIKKPFYKKIWFWLLALIIVWIAVSGGEEKVDIKEEVATVQESSTDAEVVENTEPETVESESSEVAEEPEEKVSQEFKNALKKGQSYAEMMNMSKIGVYNQLTSEYGEGFPAEAAQYAIDNLEIDWKENALEKAKSYYEGMSMSKDGVYEQLVSEHGENFTAEEAQYAVDNLE